jgi:hypothetical protein
VPPLICASGGAIATVDLRVTSPSKQHQNQPLPLHTMNLVEEGDTIRYKPVLRPHEERKGDVTLVLVPANKKTSPEKAGRENLKIFGPRPAAQSTEWTVPWRTSLVAFVYGPSGLNVKKVEAFLDSDDDLVGQLADYADKTEKTEALIAALITPGSSSAAVNAALQGFSSKFGATVQLSKDSSTNQQAAVMFQTLNPSVAALDPLAPQAAQPVGQAAGLATLAGEMFFGSPVGLAAGGTAMLLDLGAMAFPRSEFRSAFSQAMPDDALGLCGKTGASAAHTRLAYVWATRVPNAAQPRLTVGKDNSLPASVKSPLPLTAENPPEAKPASPLIASDPTGDKAPRPLTAAGDDDWKYLSRARNWMLQPSQGKPLGVKVQVLASTKSIELDLGKELKPGRYSLLANWDWDQFQVSGQFDVRSLADFTSAKLAPAAQDSFVANTGKLPLTLQGADFEFVTKVEIKRLNDEFASATPIPFVLSKGIRAGVQDHMDIQVDTGSMDTGAYKLIVSQVDGKPHDVPVKLLPALPVLTNLPVTVNQGVSIVSVDLKGTGLQLLQSLKLSKGTATLGAGSADGTLRNAVFKLAEGMTAGAEVSLQAIVADRSTPLTIDDALRIVAPKPLITGVTISQLPTQAVHLDNGELPGGLILSAMLQVANLPAESGVRLECEQTAAGAINLHPGQQASGAKLEQLAPDQLFLTFDTSAWSNGCGVQATVTSGLGDSAPRRIARVVDIPAVDEFDLTPDAIVLGEMNATLIGRNLETIDKTGWTPEQGTSVAELPQPLADRRQKLQVRLTAPPSPDAVLYVWLRGDSKPRITTVHATPY